MPGVYAEGEVDVAGTIVGVVDEADLLPRLDAMAEGDVLIGLPSSGLHTNGYSLARKVCFELEKLDVTDTLPGTDQTVADALLAIHRSYLAPGHAPGEGPQAGGHGPHHRRRPDRQYPPRAARRRWTPRSTPPAGRSRPCSASSWRRAAWASTTPARP